LASTTTSVARAIKRLNGYRLGKHHWLNRRALPGLPLLSALTSHLYDATSTPWLSH
jgi:hypothetical protein